MAKKTTMEQHYPRISNEGDSFFGYLDETQLISHSCKIEKHTLHDIIRAAVENANKKSSRAILQTDENMSEAEFHQACIKAGKELFHYFKKYCGDPASTALACQGAHYSQIAREHFRNRTLQKERMNSGWRYQYIAKDGAYHSQRFTSVSDLGTSEADFCVSIRTQTGMLPDSISIYVSVKNRVNTMGGQDWPKAIAALESVARTDRNRTSPYLCVFGIAMEKGLRHIKRHQRTHLVYSHNTEIWKSDFFWPFFTNCSYEEIIVEVLNILIELGEKDEIGVEIPQELIDSFGQCCREKELLDEQGYFHDPLRLVSFFVG